jgi:mono/diheme cytochrome c family protein
MKPFVLGFLSAIAVLVGGAIGYLRLGAAQVRADVEAPAWQSGVFHFAARAAVRRRAAGVASPAAPTDDELIAGGKLYMDGCFGCHGRPGGPPRKHRDFLGPPEFAHAGTPYSESEAFWVIRHGIRRTGMSAYGGDYSERQLWALAAFVKRMKVLPPSVRAAIQSSKP